MERFRKMKFMLYFTIINVLTVCLMYFFWALSTPPHVCKQFHVAAPKTRPFRTNIFYLKTHKTASSTIQNVIMRFGLRHSLNFLLPKTNNYLGYRHPITKSDIDPDTTILDHKFNIFTHHTRYHSSTNKYLYNDTIRVTSLRNPADLFESAFKFYGLQTYYKMSLPKFLESLPTTRKAFVRINGVPNGYNQMCYDLGMPERDCRNETAVRAFIDYIEHEFDYVMITEYLGASLAMLADLMGWPLQYVTSLPQLNRPKFERFSLTPENRVKLQELNSADTQLYNHFLEKFRARVIEYGVSRLADDIQKLYAMNADLMTKCVSREDYKGLGRTAIYRVPKNLTNWECLYTTKLELDFTDELRHWQKSRLKSLKKLFALVSKPTEEPTTPNSTKTDE